MRERPELAQPTQIDAGSLVYCRQASAERTQFEYLEQQVNPVAQCRLDCGLIRQRPLTGSQVKPPTKRSLMAPAVLRLSVAVSQYVWTRLPSAQVSWVTRSMNDVTWDGNSRLLCAFFAYTARKS